MVRPAALWTVVTTCSAALWLGGRHVLPAPPVAHPGDLAAWWSGLGPVTATFAAARAGLVAATGLWALALTAVLILRGVIAVGLRLPGRLERCLTWAGTGGGRRLLPLILGISTSGGLLGGCGLGGAGSATATAPPAPLRDVPPPLLLGPPSAGPAGGPSPAVAARAGSVGATQAGPGAKRGDARAKRAGATAKRAGASGSSGGATQAGAGAKQAGAGATRADAGAKQAGAGPPTPAAGMSAAPERSLGIGAEPAPPPPTWTVRPGDDFWSIAEAVVISSGASADPGRVARYWSRMLAANRRRLPVPGDPNFLFPGDVIVLPPLYGPSS